MAESLQPYTIIAAVQEGRTRGRFWHVEMPSADDYGDLPDSMFADLEEAWEIVAIIPGHVTPDYLGDR